MRRLTFFGVFAVAIWALGELWVLVGPVWEQGRAGPWLAALGYTAVVAATVFYLGFLLYEADRAGGRVKRPIALYDRWIAIKQRRVRATREA